MDARALFTLLTRSCPEQLHCAGQVVERTAELCMVRPRVASLISKWANVMSCINVSDHISVALSSGP